MEKLKYKRWPARLYSDSDLNELYPLSIRMLANSHWTPLAIAERAALFLAGDGHVRILDIGSGAGKFCLAGASRAPNAFFYGVEQRRWLIEYAEAARTKLQLGNVTFLHANFTQLDLKAYDHFYFYNSFYENIGGSDRLDESIEYSLELYNYYTRYLSHQLQQMRAGTRVCTLCSLGGEIPPGFRLVKSEVNDQLRFWEKI